VDGREICSIQWVKKKLNQNGQNGDLMDIMKKKRGITIV
jgi:hypothetical protein